MLVELLGALVNFVLEDVLAGIVRRVRKLFHRKPKRRLSRKRRRRSRRA